MNITEEIIDKVLSNKATKEEAQNVSRWFATTKGQEFLSHKINKEAYLDELLDILDIHNEEIPSERMKERFIESIIVNKKKSRRWKWIAAVAIPFIFMAATLGYVVNQTGILEPTEYAELNVPYGEQMRIILQDGSIVHLNSGTKFRYPKKFELTSRNVALNGEAYFEVNKERFRPFRVNLNGIYVEVTGTKFNVKAYGQDKLVNVCLDEGSVALKNDISVNAVLKPKEYIIYNRLSGKYSVEKMQDTQSVTAWRTSSLNFYKTPLKDILNTLTRQYGVSFTNITNDVQNVRFTISTSKRHIEDILKDLEYVSSIKFTMQDNDAYKVSTAK